MCTGVAVGGNVSIADSQEHDHDTTTPASSTHQCWVLDGIVSQLRLCLQLLSIFSCGSAFAAAPLILGLDSGLETLAAKASVASTLCVFGMFTTGAFHRPIQHDATLLNKKYKATYFAPLPGSPVCHWGESVPLQSGCNSSRNIVPANMSNLLSQSQPTNTALEESILLARGGGGGGGGRSEGADGARGPWRARASHAFILEC